MTIAFLIDSVDFTRAVINGQTSLGGSESACLGLARALKARGHDVHCFATKLAPDANNFVDAAGVTWHHAEDFASMNQWVEWDVVCALRQFVWFGMSPVHAKLRLLWNQDLLLHGAGAQVMSIAWALDHLVYVSDYHRAQWEDAQKELAPLGWVTKNGFDPALVPTNVTKDPNRIIHITRPERGLGPLLAMWPALRAKHPHATLQICRYNSMYDAGGWGRICASYDDEVARVNAKVGGITYLGELNKPQLYRAIAESAVMWYPGVHDFAETSCIAAIEAQACGTPFVGSYKGALPETVPSGVLIKGDATSEVYQAQSISAVLELLEQCSHNAFNYRARQRAGREHVKDYTFDILAGEWEAQINLWFEQRYQTHKGRVLEQLLHDDDHTAAAIVAREMVEAEDIANGPPDTWTPDQRQAVAAIELCDRVIRGLEQGPEQYAAHAIQDPLDEVRLSGRFQHVGPHFAGCTRLLDVACGNGSGAITFALMHPQLEVVGIDYAAGNIALATDAAKRAGVADRCVFIQGAVYDFETQAMHADWERLVSSELHDLLANEPNPFDAVFVGEFIEHVANCDVLVDALEVVCAPGAKVVYTCPMGPFVELMPRNQPIQRGHVHSFKQSDIKDVFGAKLKSGADFLAIGVTPRGAPIGHWLIHYEVAHGRKAGKRNYDAVVRRTRPMQKLTVGLIALNAENDLGRCLTSIWNIADEIIVGDTGSGDQTREIALSYGAKVIDLDPIAQQPEGFAGARNAVLAEASGDWFLWIDADEQLMEPHQLRRYLEGQLFNGYVLHQTHLYLDQAPTWDIPVRLFRTGKNIRFYGCIHEQPQMGGPNEDIYPTLEPFDVELAHTGYLTNEIREEKRTQRNYPLITVDQHVFPDRILGKVILMREVVLQADTLRAQAGGQLTERAAAGYAHAITVWDRYFTDPGHKLHKLARPWYEAALRGLGQGYEMEVALAGKRGGLGGSHARPERVWVRSIAELEQLLTWQTAEMRKRVEPAPCKTDPFTSGSSTSFAVEKQEVRPEVPA